MIKYASTMTVNEIENLISGLMDVADLVTSPCISLPNGLDKWEVHLALANLGGELDQHLNQRFEVIG